MNRTKLINLCRTNGFTLKEFPLEGRLLMVFLPPKIMVKRNLKEKKKQALMIKTISYLQNQPQCRKVIIFWEGKEEFFVL